MIAKPIKPGSLYLVNQSIKVPAHNASHALAIVVKAMNEQQKRQAKAMASLPALLQVQAF